MSNLYNLEFKKVHKKPITIIGTFLLILLMIALAFSFNPIKINKTSYIDSPTTNIYDEYSSEINPKIQNQLSQSKNIVNYYDALKTRQDQIKKLDNEINIEFQNLEIIKTRGNNEEINEQGLIIFEILNEYTSLISSFPDMTNIDYIYNISVNENYINNMYFTNMRQWTTYIENLANNHNENLGNQVYDILVANSFSNVLKSCTEISINFINYTLNNYYNTISNNYKTYKEYISSTTNATFRYTQANNYLETLKSNVEDFATLYNQIMAYSYDIIITKQDNIDTIDNLLTQILPILSITNNVTRAEHQATLNNLLQSNFVTKFHNFINNITIVAPENEIVIELKEYIKTSEKNYVINEQNIISAYNTNDSLNLQTNINKQIYLAECLTILINDTISIACYDQYNLYEKYIDDNKIYDSNCGITLAKYYITNNNSPTNIIENFQFNYQVNSTISCYDYIVFALKIATTIIILIQAINIGSLIAGERKNGNLRMLLMSPNKRSKIFNSKFCSTITSSLIMLLLSLITASITGVIVFGDLSGQIITVFNSTTVIVIEPIISVLINVLCQFIEILAFISIFWIFSITIKNFSLSSSLSIVTYLICILISKISWPILSIFPSNNFNLNKYFYTKTYTSNNILNFLFDTTAYSSQNFYLSICITIVFIIILYLINRKVFNKKSY